MKKSFFISLVITAAVFLSCYSFLLGLTSYLHPLVIPVVICCIFFFFYSLILFLRKENLEISYSLFTGIITVYTFALLVLLFFRPITPQNNYSYNLIPFSTVAFYLSGKVKMIIAVYNLAANIGLFVPFGIYLMLKSKKSFVIHVFVPLICIILIEIVQLLTHRGSLDIDDLILNFLGITIGYFAYPAFNKIVTIKKRAQQC